MSEKLAVQFAADVPEGYVPVKGWTPAPRKNGSITCGYMTPDGDLAVIDFTLKVETRVATRKEAYDAATSPQTWNGQDAPASHGAPRRNSARGIAVRASLAEEARLAALEANAPKAERVIVQTIDGSAPVLEAITTESLQLPDDTPEGTVVAKGQIAAEPVAAPKKSRKPKAAKKQELLPNPFPIGQL
jgi:hypothetical protein